MILSPLEKEKIKALLLNLVKKKHEQSDGHCGFHVMEILYLLEELVDEGKVQARDTIHETRYFLKEQE